MSRRRSMSRLTNSPGRWVTYDEPSPQPPVDEAPDHVVPPWYALPMPYPWDGYYWHQWHAAWAESVTLRICDYMWRTQGARFYATHRDQGLRDDLKDWLWVTAVEIAAEFNPDPWHPNPAGQWGAFLKGSLLHRSRHHFGMVIGQPSSARGRAAVEAHRSGIDSTDRLDALEADEGIVETRHALHGHSVEFGDPAGVLIRLEELSESIREIESRGQEELAAATPAACYITGCTSPIFSKRLCKKHYTSERRRLAENCNQDGCTTPVHARGLCNAHYAQLREASLAAGTWGRVKKEARTCEEPGCSEVLHARKLCKRHWQAMRRRERRARGES